MSRDLTKLFSPRSIAVIGASESPQKVGSVTLQNIITSGFTGHIYPINPHVKNIGAMRFYDSIQFLPEIPDLAVIAIPSVASVPEITRCAEFGVKNFVVFTAGFKEIGAAGQPLEQALIEVATKYDLNIIGPNCLGFSSPQNKLNITFGQVIKQTGDLKIISQSGAIATAYFEYCRANNLGFNSCVTLGNKSVVNENDILDYWENDPSPLGLYLESIVDGDRFIDLVTKVSQKFPVIVLKPGKSPQAAAAMKSHTGSIATPDFILDAALHQSGAIRCSDINQFFFLSKIISQQQIPSGPNVVIISNAGGPSVLATDALAVSGLKLAQFTPDTKQKLSAALPPIIGLNNPLDLLGDAPADRFQKSLEIICHDPQVDSIIVIVTPQLMTQLTQTAQVVADIAKKSSKPIFYTLIPESYPEQTISALSSLWHWQQWRQSKPSLPSTTLPHDSIQSVFDSSPLNELAQNLLQSISIPTPATRYISTLNQATEFVQKNNYPVVLKVSSGSILHKTEVGGVILNIDSPIKLSSAFNQLISISPILQIQTQIDQGIEIIVGCKRDPTFGPIMLFGAGGKFAELISDRNLTLLPLTSTTITNLVANSQVAKLLSGFRGDTVYNLDPLYQAIQKIAQLFLDFPAIAEMEINPLVITHHGVFALDPKIILK